MVAVREILANALVHRDYRQGDMCVHVRLFQDRLEITSPGTWTGLGLAPEVEHQMGTLMGESVKRNFRLAHVLSWIQLVEGEGSGIPTALRDCYDNESPAPTVRQEAGFVTVTLRPREGFNLPVHEAIAQLREKSPPVSGAAPPLRPPPRVLVAEAHRNSPRRPQRRDVRLALWGAPGAGKSTYLAALSIAISRGMGGENFIMHGIDEESSWFLSDSTNELASERRFPRATREPNRLSFRLTGELLESAPRRWFLTRPRQVLRPVSLDLDIIDPPGRLFDAGHSDVDLIDHLMECQGIIYLFDPVREAESGDSYSFFHRTIEELARRAPEHPHYTDSRIPHHVALCVTKFDDADVYRTARRLGVTVTDDYPPYTARVPDEYAEDFFRNLCRSSRSNGDLLMQSIDKYLDPRRIRYFVTSSVGLHVGPENRFAAHDPSNVMLERDGTRLIRGRVHPVNVAEPLLWLASESRYA
jgi:hypothetical protein